VKGKNPQWIPRVARNDEHIFVALPENTGKDGFLPARAGQVNTLAMTPLQKSYIFSNDIGIRPRPVDNLSLLIVSPKQLAIRAN
jgi:hypothetical protein